MTGHRVLVYTLAVKIGHCQVCVQSHSQTTSVKQKKKRKPLFFCVRHKLKQSRCDGWTRGFTNVLM